MLSLTKRNCCCCRTPHTLQLLVKFKPGVSKENRGRALGKAKSEERQMLWASDAAGATGGDLVLVKVTDNKSGRVGLKAAAADIKQGERAEHSIAASSPT